MNTHKRITDKAPMPDRDSRQSLNTYASGLPTDEKPGGPIGAINIQMTPFLNEVTLIDSTDSRPLMNLTGEKRHFLHDRRTLRHLNSNQGGMN